MGKLGSKVFGKVHRKTIKERITPKWDSYPKNWAKISKRILEKYKYTCQLCFSKKGDINLATGNKTIITVAHMDHNKQNVKDWNLLALCTSCHTKYDQGDWKFTIPGVGENG